MKNRFLTKTACYLLIGFAVVALLLSSCEKDDDSENDYKISFKSDRVLEEFTSENSLSGLLLQGGLPNRLTIEKTFWCDSTCSF